MRERNKTFRSSRMTLRPLKRTFADRREELTLFINKVVVDVVFEVVFEAVSSVEDKGLEERNV